MSNKDSYFSRKIDLENGENGGDKADDLDTLQFCIVFPAKEEGKDDKQTIFDEEKGEADDAETEVNNKSAYSKWADKHLSSESHFTKDGHVIMLKIIKCLGSDAIDAYYCSRKKDIFVILTPSLDTIRKRAEINAFSVLLDEDALIKHAGLGFPWDEVDDKKIISPFKIGELEEVTTIRPFQYIHGPYSSDICSAYNSNHNTKYNLQHLYKNSADRTHPFSNTLQIKMLIDCLESDIYDGGAELDLNDLIHNGQIMSYFPMHDAEKLQKLADNWLIWRWPWTALPFDEIKNYFGEKIGIYFKFYWHYILWLVPLSIIGFGFQLYVLIRINFSSPVSLGFSALTIFWVIFMMEYWKRLQQLTVLEWGMAKFEQEENDRADFKGDLIDSPIDGTSLKLISSLYSPNSTQILICPISMPSMAHSLLTHSLLTHSLLTHSLLTHSLLTHLISPIYT